MKKPPIDDLLGDITGVEEALADMDSGSDFADVRFKRLGAGRYQVKAEMMIAGEGVVHELECSNPAWATARLEERMVQEFRSKAEHARQRRRKRQAE
jgi:hypothetical protein